MWKITVSREELHELPPKAAQLLGNFLNISDGSLAHANDSARFYGFIRHCHSRRIKFTEEHFLELLLRVNCDDRQAEYLATAYGHGRNLLKVPCPK